MTQLRGTFIERRSPAFRRVNLAMATGGFSTFSLLYCLQPLLPTLAARFQQSPTSASLAVSLATGMLAWGILGAGAVSDRFGRRRVMLVSLAAAAALTLVVAMSDHWPTLLVFRALTGLALSGVPAVAMAYLAEEVDVGSIGLAMGLYIGGSVAGGMSGRLASGVLAELLGWRWAVALVGLTGLLSAIIFWRCLPPSRNFEPRRRDLAGVVASFGAPFRDPGLRGLFLAGFLCMGAFTAVYNYTGFRLLAPPYGLGQALASAVFALYLIGVVSSAVVGDLAGRVGRRKVFWVVVVVMLAGVGLTIAAPLAIVVAGIALLTFGFFGVHSVAASWVGRRGGENRAQAASLYMFFYYLGGSVVGTVGGLTWSRWGWTGLAGLLLLLLGTALAIAVRLASLPPKAQA